MARSVPLSVEDLRTAISSGQTFNYRLFYGHTPRSDGRLSNAVFSQFYARPFEIDGVTYQWAEQWMMASKARLFGDQSSLDRIRQATTPLQCKALGRDVRDYDDTAWSAVRFDAVTRGSVAKFGQHDDLRRYLLETADDVIVEATANDKIWGNGLAREHPDATDPRRWPGQNLLGFALMRARGMLRNDLPQLAA